MLRNNLRRLVIFFLGWSLLATACSPQRSLIGSTAANLTWSLRDLRALDAVDAPRPSQDLIAAYLRTDDDELHIRLDLLDSPELPDYDLYLALNVAPGGTTRLPMDSRASLPWEVLLVIPAHGTLGAFRSIISQRGFEAYPKTGLRVERDPHLDAVIISLDKAALGNGLINLQPIPGIGIEIFVTPAGTHSTVDHIAPFYLNAPPPSPARALLVFWNAFPAYTPLQALRRWDGAHTGPLGGRHGLGNLLRAAQSSASPLFLLDLNQPLGLSSLDAAGELEMVQSMVASGLLGLPSALPGFPAGSETPAILRPPAWAQQRAAEENLRSEAAFGLKSGSYFFSPAGLSGLTSLADEYPIRSDGIVFIPKLETQLSGDPAESIESIQAKSWNGWTVLTLPAYRQASQQPEQVSVDGPTLPLRQALIETALASGRKQGGGSPLLTLGGDLPSSAWGNPQIARTAFDYLRNHPWIRLLGPGELALEQPSLELTEDQAFGPANADNTGETLFEALHRALDNPLGAAAWQAYRAAFAPVSPSADSLQTLRAHYARQIGMLLEAARWAEEPHVKASCDVDPDQDGQAECILASESVFSGFELDQGGYLAYLFALDLAGEAHQLVAPSALLISGTSPAGAWNLGRGLLADPQALPGAFLDLQPPSAERAQAELWPDALRLGIPGSGLIKTFRLLPDGVTIAISGVPPDEGYHTSIPLSLDPWLRFQRGWTQYFVSSPTRQGWSWGDPAGLSIEISTGGAISPVASTDQLGLLGLSENPNLDAPDGFRLPFPLADGRLTADKDFSTTIRLAR
jgi:hypothetical protein